MALQKTPARPVAKPVIAAAKPVAKAAVATPVLRSAVAVKRAAAERRNEEDGEEIIRTAAGVARNSKLGSVAHIEDMDDDFEEIVDEGPASAYDPDDEVDASEEPDETVPAKGRSILLGGCRVDPGPEVGDVEFKPCCGTCAKFVRIDDPVRNDPEWELKMSRNAKTRCPNLFPQEWNLKKMDAEERQALVPTADREICKDYSVNMGRCSESLTAVLTAARESLHIGELEVFSTSVAGILKLKTKERKMGYRLGEIVMVDDDEREYKGKVVDFRTTKGAEVVIETINRPQRQIRVAIPAKRAQRMED